MFFIETHPDVFPNKLTPTDRTLGLVDSGFAINTAFPPVLRPHRHAEVILSLSYSWDEDHLQVKDKSMIRVTLTWHSPLIRMNSESLSHCWLVGWFSFPLMFNDIIIKRFSWGWTTSSRVQSCYTAEVTQRRDSKPKPVWTKLLLWYVCTVPGGEGHSAVLHWAQDTVPKDRFQQVCISAQKGSVCLYRWEESWCSHSAPLPAGQHLIQRV